MKRKWIRVLIILACVAVLIGSGITAFAVSIYRADDTAIEAMKRGTTDGRYTVFDGGGDIGLVFYPGGMVEEESYAPLLVQLADAGITSVLVRMPLKLAVLKQNAWKGALEMAPNVKTWYIGGHSLGGAMAARSATAENGFAGLILLAAYPTDTVSIPALSLYGEHDGVMNRETYQEGVAMMEQLTEYVIPGGNHAGFGCYGEQKKDGTATISAVAQRVFTVHQITAFTWRYK